ncbi:MAG: phage tail tape measure protein [Bacteroidetes bacterium]|nr:phage tail tape measure protein [Bacteroidota bacterium]
MSGVQFNIQVATGGSNAAMDGIVAGLGAITNHLNTLNQNFIGFSQKSLSGFNQVQAAANNTGSSLKKLGETAFHLNNIQTALSGISSDFEKAVQPGIDFNDQMKDLQAITGVTDDVLVKISDSARANAKAFGIDASKGVESYKLILSQLDPEIAKVPAALDSMGRHAAVLSKQMGGDVSAATSVLTTAMNQYAVSTKDPIEASKTMAKMMDIMSAGAKAGSAELPQIKSALEQSGMMAKTANVSFVELNAAIQVLDKAGKKGAEGGVAIRNMLAEMSQGAMNSPKTIAMLQAAGIPIEKLADKSKSFADRLNYLKPIVNDTAAMTQLFGKENVAAGIALVKGTGLMDEYTTKLNENGIAQEMADTKMGSFKEKMARANAVLKDLGISIFNATEGFIPFVQMGMGGLQVMANLAQASSLFSTIAESKLITSIMSSVVSMGSWIATTTAATLAQLGFNAALTANPIGLVVIAVVAVIGVVALLIKYWDNIWGAVKAFGLWVWEHNPFRFLIDVVDRVFPSFKAAMGKLWDWIVGKFEALVEWFKKAWGWIKSLFGSDDNKEATKAAVEEYAKKASNTTIEGITVQAKADDKSPLAGYNPKDHKQKNLGKDIGSNITSGGSKPMNITMHFHKLQDQIVIHTTNLQMGAKDAARQVVEEIQMQLQSIAGTNTQPA